MPPLEATLRPADLKIAALPSNEPSLGMRALRRLARFLAVLCIGVVATLAWQSYGGGAKQVMTDWARQRGWLSSRPTMNPRPAGEIASEPSSPAAGEVPGSDAVPAQAPAAAAPAPTPASLTAASEAPQLETIARDLAAVRQNLERLSAGQGQVARDLARLQTTEQEIQSKVSTPPPRPSAPPRKPASTATPAAPKPSATSPPPGTPEPPGQTSAAGH